ncbi:hypothetical protein R3P38DRAFT_2848780 [Favolaschia claudopus]|uniref:Uncharacterized protein n=1 Tax=Favolaschia claudopus TaxID=2862362 RepID=A0AAW0DSW1_9AGAR
MEEWRRETDVEGVRPPPSPVTSPGLLSPYGTIQASNVQQRPSQESFGSTNLRRSSSGSSSQTIGITIEPPSRPASIGIHAAGNQPPAEGSAHLLSPNHQPVLLAEDDEESDDNDDSDSDDAPMPPGFVMGPLPAFAQGVSPLPPGFVPTPSGTQARSLQGGSSWGAPPQPPPAQPIPTNANANAAWSLPSFPAPAGGAGNPVTITGTWGTPAASGASTGNPAIVNATWAPRVAPPHLPGPPVSTGAGIYGGVPANPAFGARAAPPLTVEPVTRPASRNAMPGGFNVEPVVRPASRLGGMPAAAAGVGAEPPRPPSRQMGGILGNPASGFTVEPVVRPSSRIGISSGSFTAEPSATRPFGGMPGGNSALGSFAVESATRPPSRGPVPGNTTSGLTVESSRHPLPIRVGAQPGNSFTVEPARPPSRLGNPVSGGFGAEPGAQPPSRLGNLHTGGFTVEPARPQSRQGMHATSAWGGPAVVGGNPVGPQQASGSSFPSNAASSNKWSMSGQFGFGQGSTPSAQPMRPLGFAPPPTADSAGSAGTAPRSPLPTRLRTFADNPSERSTTPRPSLYGPPAPTAAPSGTGYFAPTPGVAAGYPLPTSRSNSTATTMSHPRIANVNAGTTPAAFNTTALSRPTSQSSSGGRSRFNNQTPHPSTNLGITDPYTTARIEQDDSSSDGEGSLGGLARMTSFDRVTATNTRANAGGAGGIYAGGGGFGAPFIPPSPANSYRPMR